jgi:glycine oxidase
MANADVVVVGGGLVGLACAAAIARSGASVAILDYPHPGGASTAAAGMLAPSVDRADGAAAAFAVAARDRYPSYVDWLAETSRVAIPLNRAGILQVAATPSGVRGLRKAIRGEARWLDRAALLEIEPSLTHALGAVHHPLDGAVDNVALVQALATFANNSARVRVRSSRAVELTFEAGRPTVRTQDGTTHGCARVVLAGGAWSGTIAGLPRPLPVVPLRGEMLAYVDVGVRHVLFGPRGYVVPRATRMDVAAETLVGATSDAVGFDASTTTGGGSRLRDAGAEILSRFRLLAPVRHWAGLRPMTPDLLPIIGPDPDEPSILYACGHSRNGILTAPLTGDCIAALVRGDSPPHDLQPFRIDRFPAGGKANR